MSNSGTGYLVDTDVLVRIRDRPDSNVLYSGVIRLARQGVVKTVRQVFDELSSHGEWFKFLMAERQKFQIPADEQFSPGVQAYIEQLGKVAPYLYEQTGGKNPDPADPWLVAVTAHFGYKLVTNERPFSEVRIPAACRAIGIGNQCISGPHFLIEAGLVTEIKPEHVSVEAFFREG